MDTPTLSQILADMPHQDGSFSAEVPAHWTQGRTTYGGFSATLLLAAARKQFPDLPPLRSMMVNFTAPIGTPPQISAEILRQGRNITTVQAIARIEGKVAALATLSFGRAQDSHLSVDLAAPEAKAPEQTEPYFPPQMKRPPVPFLANFDVHLIEGDRPFMGADRGYVRVWARHRDPAMWDSPEGLISIADIPPPAVFTMATKMGPNSSVNWICNVLSETLTTRDGWWMIESALTAGHDGYSSQVMRMWNSDGQLVVDGMQSVVIFV
ncbi:thioesterase family protein [Shimia sp. SDUM112013]|uniref:acyl-CoA thioesterase n=1 Tax=Shimia sp. SDUM112013 TaxID=3136160 RepID=UPI0032EC2C5B